MISSAQMVFCAVRAGLRLYSAGRRAYVEAALDRPLLLPLPAGPGITPASAVNFFRNDDKGKFIAAQEENELIRALLATEATGSLTREEEQELMQIYAACLRELRPGGFEGPLSLDEPRGWELVPIMTVRQWSRGEIGDHPTALQRIAGTLVNVAVDHFAHTPGEISDRSPAGRTLKAFLETVDKLDFAEAPPAEVAGDLLVAVLDSAAAHPGLIGNTDTEGAIVRSVTGALVQSAGTLLDRNMPTEELRRGSLWLQTIGHAVIGAAAGAVLAGSCAVPGVGTAGARGVREVAGTIADLVIGSNSFKFQALLSGQGINAVVKAALRAAAWNPGILRIGHHGLRSILVGVAEGISEQPNLLSADIFPELAGLVIETSADHLDRLWPDGSCDPAAHLLLTAVRELFLALAEGTREGEWPALTKSSLMEIAEAVLNEIVENPGWVLKGHDFGEATALSVAVRAALDSLGRHGGWKFSGHTAAAAVMAAVRACGMRMELLRRLPAGGVDAGKIALSAAMDAVLTSALGDGVAAEKKWVRARNSALTAALETALAALAKVGAGQKHIDVLRREIGGLMDERLTADQLGERLERLLKSA